MTNPPTSPSPSLDAILSLMSDPDPVAWKSVENHLMREGDENRPFLRDAAEDGKCALVRIRAREILAKIHETTVTGRFRRWSGPGNPDPDLEEGWVLLTQLEYPDLDVSHYRRKLDAMAADLDPRLRGTGDFEALRILQRYIHFDKEFRGNVEGYYEPENNYLNCVLDRGVGIPITLSSLYLLVTRRLGLPVEGIAAPGHFLLRYRTDRADAEPVYIDAFHGGRNLDRKKCVAFLRSIGHVVRGELDRPADSRQILSRMCRNLITIYETAGLVQKSGRLDEWVKMLGGETVDPDEPDTEPG